MLTLLQHHSRTIHTNLLVHLYHGASEGVYPPGGTPHTVSSQTVVENSPEVCAVHCLELVIIRVAAGGVQSGGDKEGEGEKEGKEGER